MQKLILTLKITAAFCLSLLLITTSVWQPITSEDAIRPATRPFEFDYLSWTINAFVDKLSMSGLGFNHYLEAHQDRKIIQDYFILLSKNEELENAIEVIFADPGIENPDQESADLKIELAANQNELKKQSSLAESVIQKQISSTLNDMGLATLGQPFPPVLYHVTDLPKELIISPRDVIEQAASISLRADISLDDTVKLEDEVEAGTDYSALVVSIGGVGTYPTMVISTSSLPYLIETVAHEWTHNYLNLRPLGLHYSASPELRTMNETTASIAGEEISQAVIRNFYADLLTTSNTPYQTYDIRYPGNSTKSGISSFDFRQEMYQTRVRVDELLSQGKIQEAEGYMEERRQVFWENGYSIRKLNQAYFAFNGAYADQAYSAAGEDPVGAAVRSLRSHSSTLAEFINKMSTFSSYDQLYTLVNVH